MTSNNPSQETATPISETEKKDGFTKVDTEVQEEAAKEREESGGYD
jgi:hypothetical protein